MIVVTCRELTEMATDRREGALPLSDRAGVALHLSWCTRCRRYLEQMDVTVAALGQLPEEPVPDDVYASVVAAVARRKSP